MPENKLSINKIKFLYSSMISITSKNNSEFQKWKTKAPKKFFLIFNNKISNSDKEIINFHSKNIPKNLNKKPSLKKFSKESDSSKISI
jgi:hypothetical protein